MHERSSADQSAELDPEAPASGVAALARARTPGEWVLALQRSAGNAAVGRLLARAVELHENVRQDEKVTIPLPSYIRLAGAELDDEGLPLAMVGATIRLEMMLDHTLEGTQRSNLDAVAAHLSSYDYDWTIAGIERADLATEVELAAGTAPFGDVQVSEASGQRADARRTWAAISEDVWADLLDLGAVPADLHNAYLATVATSAGVRLITSGVMAAFADLTKAADEARISFAYPGEYLVRCIARSSGALGVRRAPSIALLRVRVMTLEQRAQQAEGAPEERERTHAKNVETRQRELKAERVLTQQLLGGVASPSENARWLGVWLAQLGRTPQEHMEAIDRDLTSVREAHSRLTGYALEGVLTGEGGDISYPLAHSIRAVVVEEDTGAAMPLLLVLGQTRAATDGRLVEWRLADVTSAQTQAAYYGRSRLPAPEGDRAAIDDALRAFREENPYGRGLIVLDLPHTLDEAVGPLVHHRELRSAPGRWERGKQKVRDIAAVANVAAFAGGPLGVAAGTISAVAQTGLAVENMRARRAGGRFAWDMETFMDVSSIVGSAVALGVPALGAAGGKWSAYIPGEGALRGFTAASVTGQVLVVETVAVRQLEALQREIEARPPGQEMPEGEIRLRRAEILAQASWGTFASIATAAQALGAPDLLWGGKPVRVEELEAGWWLGSARRGTASPETLTRAREAHFRMERLLDDPLALRGVLRLTSKPGRPNDVGTDTVLDLLAGVPDEHLKSFLRLVGDPAYPKPWQSQTGRSALGTLGMDAARLRFFDEYGAPALADFYTRRPHWEALTKKLADMPDPDLRQQFVEDLLEEPSVVVRERELKIPRPQRARVIRPSRLLAEPSAESLEAARTFMNAKARPQLVAPKSGKAYGEDNKAAITALAKIVQAREEILAAWPEYQKKLSLDQKRDLLLQIDAVGKAGDLQTTWYVNARGRVNELLMGPHGGMGQRPLENPLHPPKPKKKKPGTSTNPLRPPRTTPAKGYSRLDDWYLMPQAPDSTAPVKVQLELKSDPIGMAPKKGDVSADAVAVAKEHTAEGLMDRDALLAHASTRSDPQEIWYTWEPFNEATERAMLKHLLGPKSPFSAVQFGSRRIMRDPATPYPPIDPRLAAGPIFLD